MNNLPTNHDDINGENNNHVDDSCSIALREADPNDDTDSPKKVSSAMIRSSAD